MAQDFVNVELKKIDAVIAYIATRTWIKSGVYIVALLESTISPILPELVVAAVLSYRKDISWKLLSVISALGSATGASILYALGKYLYVTHTLFFDKLLGSQIGMYSEKLFEHSTFVSMFLAAFTPLPDRVFAFLSGTFSLPILVVVSAFFLGRLIRVGIIAYFSYEYGDEAREYILKHTRRAVYVIVALAVLYGVLVYTGIL
ncbi:MAG: hypothetical protein RIQ41_56 [Candidatus Parcubacteria bacterium]|jgi:membrane protein YqaA with SNARE-associated domain